LMNAHVEYKLHVKTSFTQFKLSEFDTLRRYKDFVWLREKLAEKYKGYLIPPLPEKALLNRFNTEFLENRRRELERFLQRIVDHPVLIQSTELQTFLESSESLSTPKVPAVQPRKESTSSSLFSFLGSSIESISNLNTIQNEPDQWFDAKRNYINALDSHLNSIVKSINQISKKQKELSLAMTDFSLASSLLASSEADQDQWISNSFNRLSEITTQITVLDEKLVDDQTTSFEDNIRDYIRILGAVKEMLNVRTEKLTLYQNVTKQLETKKEKFEKVKATSSKMEKEIEEAEKRMEETKEDFIKISNICKSELQRFESTKLQDIKNLLIKLTQIHINHDLLIIDQWKGFLHHLLENK